VLLSSAALAAVLLAAGGTVWAATRPGRPSVRHDARPHPGVTRSTPTHVPVNRLPSTAREAAAVLDALDSIRADAFRRRDVALLGEVYVAGPLRMADTAMVQRTVSRGCGLVGVRTTYTGIRIATSGTRVVVTATATLPTSRLVCGATARGTARGAGPTPLRIELVRTMAGVRIATQRVG
jgi:hypothetical protein